MNVIITGGEYKGCRAVVKGDTKMKTYVQISYAPPKAKIGAIVQINTYNFKKEPVAVAEAAPVAEAK